MSAPSFQPPSRISRTQYGLVALLCLAFGTIGQLAGDEPSLTALKLLVVPLWCLSIVGLNAIYGLPSPDARWTIRTVEHAVLYTVLLASVVTVLQWTPGRPLSATLLFFAIFLSVMTVFHVIVLRIRLRRPHRGTTPDA